MCVRGILFKGKSFGEVPMAILELLEFPKRKANHEPRSSVHNSEFFACDRKFFANFPKKICPNYQTCLPK